MDQLTVDKLSDPSTENTGLLSLEYKLRATVALDEGNTRSAILYQTKSLGASKQQKYSQTSRQCNDLEELVQKVINADTNKKQSPTTLSNDYDDLCKRCNELPSEWTVIQIAKEYTPLATSLVHEELLTESTPVWLTVFRCSDPCEGAPFEPILIPLDVPVSKEDEKFPNFFEHITSIPVATRNGIGATTEATSESQAERLEAVEQLISSAVQRTIEWLGPWSNLFVGKFRSPADQKLESEIYNQIEEFCVHNRIGRKGQRIVSLVARRLDLLDEFQLFELCACEQLDLDDAKVEALYTLLVNLRQTKFKERKEERLNCYPVMLIVDELLDGMPWEMVHPSGEFCRFANFSSLSELYRAHAKRIKNGYFTLSAKQCFTIINPDKDLEKMSARLQMFYKELYPNFELLVDEPPKESEFAEVLNTSDVVIYNGHGSGLQFMNGETLLQRDINCVTFLFGCDSVRLYSNGLFTDMTGTHMYYNAAHCPTVVGALWVLTDLFTDFYSMLLVGSWIPSTNPAYANKDISSCDMLAFKAGKLADQHQAHLPSCSTRPCALASWWWSYPLLSLLLLQLPSSNVFALQKEMTISVAPRNVDCFYESAKAGQTIDIEYQVIDGGHGDLDISFELAEVTGRTIFADYKKSDNIHRFPVPYDGEYKFCFDNGFSRTNSKTVFFELIIEREGEQEDPAGWSDIDLLEGLTPEEFYDMKVQDMEDAIKRVRNNLTKARQLQDVLRSHEARDRNVAEENYFKVNVWSFFQILVMVAVGTLQVVMVKSLFDVDSRAYKLLTKL
uniref:Separase n=1 Tax=Anopheles christyi TaxID=43041 RepID=A0A182JTM2_9DIPT